MNAFNKHSSVVWNTFLLVIAAHLCGCSDPKPQRETVERQPPENAQPATQAAPVASVAVKTVKIPEEWLAPFSAEDNFFAAPAVSGQNEQLQVIEATEEHQSVRLLGFADKLTNGSQVRNAILKIGGEMIFMAEGETRLGVELLRIEGRTVHLHRGRDRWNLALMKQPQVNPGIKPPAAANRRPTKGRNSRETPNAEPWEPASPGLPDVPDLKIPDIKIPGAENLSEALATPSTELPSVGLPEPEDFDSELGMEELDLSLPELPDIEEEPDFPTP